MSQTTNSRALYCRSTYKFTCDIHFLGLVLVFTLANNLRSCSWTNHLFLITEESEFLLDALIYHVADAESSVDGIYVK